MNRKARYQKTCSGSNALDLELFFMTGSNQAKTKTVFVVECRLQPALKEFKIHTSPIYYRYSYLEIPEKDKGRPEGRKYHELLGLLILKKSKMGK